LYCWQLNRMDTIINNLAQMNLNNVGSPGNEQQKRTILGNIRAINLANWNSIDQITEDEIETFNNEVIIEYQRVFTNFFQTYGNHGSLNCGRGLAYYTNILNEINILYNGIQTNTNYASIQNFILAPIQSLPDTTIIRGYDKATGEKTFSKMCLNLAVKLAMDRLNFVEGYWTKRQMVDFPDV